MFSARRLLTGGGAGSREQFIVSKSNLIKYGRGDLKLKLQICIAHVHVRYVQGNGRAGRQARHG